MSLWIYSAAMNLMTAPVVLYFAAKVTDGAGFKCKLAFIRLLQRLALCFLAGAALLLALHTINTKHDPLPEGFIFQVAFTLAWATSMVRHLWSPPIPENATWRRPARPLFH
jgi:hypothetical protein